MSDTKTARRHEARVGDVTAYAGPWRGNVLDGHRCTVILSKGQDVEVIVGFQDFEVVPEARGLPIAALPVLAAVLQEAAEIAETGVIPGEVPQ